MTKPTLKDADPVKVKVGDTTYTLNATIEAARLINDFFGGVFSDAGQRIQRADISAIVAVINAGTGGRLTSVKERELWEAIWRAEPDEKVEIAKPVYEFLAIVRNGGRPLPEVDETEEAEAPEGNG